MWFSPTADYRRWIAQQPSLLRELPALRGQRLGHAEGETHAAILAELANALPDDVDEFEALMAG